MSESERPDSGFFVVVCEAQEVTPGDVIWAPDDGDWFEVARVSSGGYYGQEFSRSDGSIAQFDDEDRVLVRR
jgi:hypothetical protein